MVKAPVKHDRSKWLDKLLQDGNWGEIRKLRKGFKLQQGRLRNMDGELVSSEERAETLAEYYEKIRWAVRPTQAGLYTDHLGAALPLEAGSISEGKVVAAGRRLNN